MAYAWVRTCAWCKRTLTVEWDRPLRPEDVRPVELRLGSLEPSMEMGVETHTICEKCRAEQMKAVNALPTTTFDERQCSHGVPGNRLCIDCEATCTG